MENHPPLCCNTVCSRIPWCKNEQAVANTCAVLKQPRVHSENKIYLSNHSAYFFSHFFNSSLLHIQPMSLPKAFESVLNCEVFSVIFKPWYILDCSFVRLENENAIMLLKHFIIFELLQLLNESHSATYKGMYLSCERWQLLLSLSVSAAFNLLVLTVDHKPTTKKNIMRCISGIPYEAQQNHS